MENKYTYEVVEWVLGDKTVTNIKRTSADSEEVSMIPTDPSNSDYQAYLKSLETDNPEYAAFLESLNDDTETE